MRTEDLIVKLAREAVPVTSMRRLAPRLAIWMLIAMAAVAIGVAIIGPRADLAAQMRRPAYLVSLGLTLGMGLLGAAGALALAVPYDRRTPLATVAPLALAAGWGAILVGQLAQGGDVIGQFVRDTPHAACFFQIALTAVVPAAVLFRSIRRAASLDIHRTAALAALGTLGISAAGAQLTCPYDVPAHLFLWHFGTVIGLVLVSLTWARPALARVIR